MYLMDSYIILRPTSAFNFPNKHYLLSKSLMTLQRSYGLFIKLAIIAQKACLSGCTTAMDTS